MSLEKIEQKIAQLKKELENLDSDDRQYFYTLGVMDGLSAASKLVTEAPAGSYEKVYILHADGTIGYLVKNEHECGFYVDVDSALKDAHAIDHLNN